MPRKDDNPSVKLLRRWLMLYKAGRIRPDPGTWWWEASTMPRKDDNPSVKLLRRWLMLYKAGRIRPDPDVTKLATETDAYVDPVPVPRPETREGNA